MNPRHPSLPVPARRVVVSVVAALMIAGACSGDDESAADPPVGTEAPATDGGGNADGDTTDDGDSTGGSTGPAGSPAEPVTLADLAAASGDAPAATGADLTGAPGPADRTAVPGVGEVAASITAADGTVTGCCLMVAASDRQRQRGLMEVTDLGGYQGMVFVWDHDTEGAFWMRNTPTPLSIAWFDAEGEFVSATDMAPCSATADDCPTYPPEGPYRFAVEVFEGDLEALGVGPGSRLTLGGECAGAATAG